MPTRKVDKVDKASTSTSSAASSVSRQALHASPERKAVAVDAGPKARNLTRLRRIEGQVRGLQRMVEEDRYCADILVQISSVQEALRAVARALMRNHLRHCATHAIRADEADAEAMYEELLELMFKHTR